MGGLSRPPPGAFGFRPASLSVRWGRSITVQPVKLTGKDPSLEIIRRAVTRLRESVETPLTTHRYIEADMKMKAERLKRLTEPTRPRRRSAQDSPFM
jgi:hypothetical protein